MSKKRSAEVEGLKRAGRVGLWATLPPVGLWRSVRHGKERSEDRLAEKIAQATANQQPERTAAPSARPLVPPSASKGRVTVEDHSKNGLKDVRTFSRD